MNKRGAIVTFMPLKWYLIGMGVLILAGVIYYIIAMHNVGVDVIHLPSLPASCPNGIIPEYITTDCPSSWADVTEWDSAPCRGAMNQGENINYLYCNTIYAGRQIINPDWTLGKRTSDLKVDLVLNMLDNQTVGGGEPDSNTSIFNVIFHTPNNGTVICNMDYMNRDIVFYKVISVKCSQ